MYYLGIDTSNNYVIVSIFNDEKELYFKQVESLRNASEITNVMVDEALSKLNIKASQIDAVIVTRGPGSFTGVRIGISFAKVFAMILDIPLYSVSSMQYYSGLSSIPVILDARSKKVFIGEYNEGEIVSESISMISDVDLNKTYLGKASLVDGVDNFQNLEGNFLKLKDYWNPESYFDAKPSYLKDNL